MPALPAIRSRRGLQVAFIIGLLSFLILRLCLATARQLVPDEAVYWTWSRHLALGYLDHPPMVAYLIRLSTLLLGSTELGVRMPAALLAVGSAGVLVALAWRVSGDVRLTGFVALVWLSSPLLAVLGGVMTPDTPAFFFSCCALASAILAVRSGDGKEGGWWVAFGVFCGLGMLSKYTVALLPASVGLALIASAEGRRHLRRPWIYVGALLALAIFSPVLWWNDQHQWASFRYQLNHGAGEGTVHGIAISELLGFVGGQMLVWTPILFILGIAALWIYWRRWFDGQDEDRARLENLVLLWAGTMPLLLFGIMSLRAHSEINWPGFAYAPISLLTGKYLVERWDGRRVQWAKIGCIVAASIMVVMQAPKLLFRIGIKPAPMVQMYESRPLGIMMDEEAREAPGATVVCNRHQDAAVASFYMKGQPDIWAVSDGSRLTAFDYMRGGPDFHAAASVVFMGYHVEPFCKEYGFKIREDEYETLPSVRSKKRVARVVTLVRGLPATTAATAPFEPGRVH